MLLLGCDSVYCGKGFLTHCSMKKLSNNCSLHAGTDSLGQCVEAGGATVAARPPHLDFMCRTESRWSFTWGVCVIPDQSTWGRKLHTMRTCLQTGCSPGCVTEAWRTHVAAGAFRKYSWWCWGTLFPWAGAVAESSAQAAGCGFKNRCSSGSTWPDTAMETQNRTQSRSLVCVPFSSAPLSSFFIWRRQGGLVGVPHTSALAEEQRKWQREGDLGGFGMMFPELRKEHKACGKALTRIQMERLAGSHNFLWIYHKIWRFLFSAICAYSNFIFQLLVWKRFSTMCFPLLLILLRFAAYQFWSAKLGWKYNFYLWNCCSVRGLVLPEQK